MSQISDDMSDDDLAATYADVSNKLGGLTHEFDDPDFAPIRDQIEQSIAMWHNLEDVLYEKIVNILKAENETGHHHVLSGIGTHYIVRPFMEREGFRDGNGWWIPEEMRA